LKFLLVMKSALAVLRCLLSPPAVPTFGREAVGVEPDPAHCTKQMPNYNRRLLPGTTVRVK